MSNFIKSKKFKIICVFIILIIVIIYSLIPKIVKDIYSIQSIELRVLVDSLNSKYEKITIYNLDDIIEICKILNKSQIKHIDIWSTELLQKDYDYSLVLNYTGFRANEYVKIEKDGTISRYLYGGSEGYILALNPYFVEYLDNYTKNFN